MHGHTYIPNHNTVKIKTVFSLAVHNTDSGTAILQTSDKWDILKTDMDLSRQNKQHK